MDSPKAFDTLNHEVLMAELNAYGFDASSIKLIHSYLSNRWCRTKINTKSSYWAKLLKVLPGISFKSSSCQYILE